jgi:hypothetical protein
MVASGPQDRLRFAAAIAKRFYHQNRFATAFGAKISNTNRTKT